MLYLDAVIFMFHFSTATYTQSSCCYYEHMHGVVKKQTNRLLGIKRAFFAIQFPSENSTAAQTSSKEISHPNKKSTKMKMSPTTSAITLALALATTLFDRNTKQSPYFLKFKWEFVHSQHKITSMVLLYPLQKQI